MMHVHHQLPYRENPHDNGSRPTEGTAAPSLLPNILTGVVSSRIEGLTRTVYRIRLGARTEVRISWPHSSGKTLEIGQPARLMIPQESVRLEAGGFRRGKQRWNRWIGRVVLTSCHSETGSTTVKMHQDPITLKSRGPIIGANTPLTTWDTVNIVVDPQRITVCDCESAARQEPPTRHTHRITADPPTLTWTRATIRTVRSIPLGHRLTLNVGGATLSVLIEIGAMPAIAWAAGHAMEINIGSGVARIRHDPQGPTVPCCVELSTDFNETHPMGFAGQRDQTPTMP